MKKIVFFVGVFPAISETFIINQIIGLLRSGHQVTVYASSRAAEPYHSAVIENKIIQNTIYIDEQPKSRIKNLFRLAKSIAANPGLFKLAIGLKQKTGGKISPYILSIFRHHFNADIVHAHFGDNGVYAHTLMKAGLFPDAKLVVTFHGYDAFADPAHYYQIFTDSVQLTANSRFLKAKLISIGANPNRISILPVGVNPANFPPPLKDFDDRIWDVLFVGRMVDVKAPEGFVQICSRLKKSMAGLKAAMIGDGPLSNRVKELIRESGLSENITFLGSRTNEFVMDAMADGKILIMPGITLPDGRAETQGLVIQEAQLMEMIPLVSDAGGMSEGVVDGKTGFVLPQGDVGSFVDKILFLEKQPDTRKEIGKQGRKFIMDNFDIQLLSCDLEQIYNCTFHT